MIEKSPIILNAKDLAPFFAEEHAHGFNLFLERLLRDHARITQILFLYETEIEPEYKLPPEKKNRLIIECIFLPDWVVVDRKMLEEIIAGLHAPAGLEERLSTIVTMSHVISKTTKFLKTQLGLVITSHQWFRKLLGACEDHLSEIENIQESKRLEESFSEISDHFDSIRTYLLNMKKVSDEHKELPKLASDQLDKVISYMLYLQSWMGSRSKSLAR